VELPFDWVDFGTWESVANYMKEKSMYSPEDVMEIDSNNNFIYRKNKKYIALIGMEDVIVVDTGDALLITKKEQTGKVGQIVDKLKEENKIELL
jgi:mannose-1-phosphate guanylyltransferase